VHGLHCVSRLWLWRGVGVGVWHDVHGGSVRHRRSGSVHQLQRRLRVSSRVDVGNTCRCSLCSRHLQLGRRGVVHQL
jgi:hypothetical protein